MSWFLHSLEIDALSLSSGPWHLHWEDIRIVRQVREPQDERRLSLCRFTEKTPRHFRKLVKEARAEGSGIGDKPGNLREIHP